MSRLVLVLCFLLCDMPEPQSFQDALIRRFALAEQKASDLDVRQGRDPVATPIPEDSEVKRIFLHIHLPADPSWQDVSTSCGYVCIVFLLDTRAPAAPADQLDTRANSRTLACQPAKRILFRGQVSPGSWREELKEGVGGRKGGVFLSWDFNYGGDAVPTGSVRFKRAGQGHVWQGLDKCLRQYSIDLLAF